MPPSCSTVPRQRLALAVVLADPFLRLFSGQGVIAENNNWQDAPAAAGSVAALPRRLQPSVWIRVDPIQDNRQHQQVANLNRRF